MGGGGLSRDRVARVFFFFCCWFGVVCVNKPRFLCFFVCVLCFHVFVNGAFLWFFVFVQSV